jgi:hypothetical protein
MRHVCVQISTRIYIHIYIFHVHRHQNRLCGFLPDNYTYG